MFLKLFKQCRNIMNNIDIKKYKREWAIFICTLVILFMITLVFLVFTKNIHFSFRPLYTQICKIRKGEMVDQGPIQGCFLKDKDGTFYIMGSKGDSFCRMPKLENGKNIVEGACIY